MRLALILAMLWSPLVVAACCAPRVVERPVVVRPPPCLEALPPDPPDPDAGDGAWSAYHVSMEGWAANVTRACGAHLLAQPTGDVPIRTESVGAVGHYGD